MNSRDAINQIDKNFKHCSKSLNAISDPIGQIIILSLLKVEANKGLRVGDLMKETHLSRAALANYLKVLKEENLIDYYCEGTKNYYYLCLENKMIGFNELLKSIEFYFNINEKEYNDEK